MATTFDSPNSDDFVSPVRLTVFPRLEYPFRQDLTAIFYRIDYVQRAEFFVPSALDLTCPDNSSAFLIEESAPRQKGNGLCRFTRTFATVPADRTEYATGSFAFPSYKTDSASTTFLRPTFTQTVVAKVDFVYVKTTDPGADLTITNRFQPLDSAANKVNFVASDTTPTLTEYQNYVSGTPGGAILKEDGGKILLEDGVDALLEESGGVGTSTYVQSKETRVRRWKGNIWETSTRFVYAL
tara:strand:+ start:1270 stop:1989 length:720 start_codon:yes stop_codon:yes gene_type:complete